MAATSAERERYKVHARKRVQDPDVNGAPGAFRPSSDEPDVQAQDPEAPRATLATSAVASSVRDTV